jgi:predicted RNase H-like nuclease (RuvC/YqgF family)
MMDMRQSSLIGALLVTIGVAGLLAAEQDNGTDSQSLGQIARKYRQERTKEAKKPARVFTNDSLGVQTVSAAPKTEAETKGAKEEKPPASPAAQPGGKPSEPSQRDESYYREKIKELRAALDLHQRELDVLKQKLSQNDMQYYPDPNKTLTQEFTRSDITKLQQEISKKSELVAADEKAIEDLEDQLRRDGGDPGWLR